MRGWYVIPVESDPEEFTGKGAKNMALKRAKELYDAGDSNVAIIHFDDSNSDGYVAGENLIFYENLIKRKWS